MTARIIPITHARRVRSARIARATNATLCDYDQCCSRIDPKQRVAWDRANGLVYCGLSCWLLAKGMEQAQ